MDSLKVKGKEKKYILVLVLMAIMGTALVEFYIYDAAKSRLLSEITERLVIGTHATAAILGEAYHNGLINSERIITSEEEIEDALRLTNFTNEAGLDYVYTLIRPEDEILFVSSSMTPEEADGSSAYESVFFTTYDQAPAELYQAFDKFEITSATYTDQWGSFLSAFVPMHAEDGSLYVVGADMTIDHVQAASRLNAYVTLAPLFLIIVLSLPIARLITYSLNKQANLEISRLYLDRITGLGNRNRLNEDLENAGSPVVFIVNIEKFREISNTYGPAVGDMMLSQYGQYLKSFEHTAMPDHHTYRLQGDEFAILIDQKFNSEDHHQAVEDFYNYANSFRYTGMDGRQVSLSITMGGSINQLDANLLADMALRHAKNTRKAMVIYDSELGIPDIYRNNLEKTEILRLALDDGRVVPYFQPIVYTETEEISHYEVLARVVDDKGNVCLSPVDFIPLAERYRLYGNVTKAIIEKTLKLMQGNEHKVCFNLSCRDIEDYKTAKYIQTRLKRSGMCNRISIELLENDSMRNPKEVAKFFVGLRRMGVKVGIDDLGKDYSNFDRVIELPLDFIKIDGAVVHHIVKDESAFEVIKKIVDVSKNCGIKTVAECIDSGKVKDVAKRLEVDFMQGFGIGEPRNTFVTETNANTEIPVAI